MPDRAKSAAEAVAAVAVSCASQDTPMVVMVSLYSWVRLYVANADFRKMDCTMAARNPVEYTSTTCTLAASVCSLAVSLSSGMKEVKDRGMRLVGSEPWEELDPDPDQDPDPDPGTELDADPPSDPGAHLLMGMSTCVGGRHGAVPVCASSPM